MPRLESRLDTRSPEYHANTDAMQAALDEIGIQLEIVLGGGGKKYVERHRARGKLGIRERIELLVDRDTPFFELSPLAGWRPDDPMEASGVAGIGVVSGVECVIGGADPTNKGGSTNPIGLTKGLRAQQIALENRLPTINLTESGGADLPRQSEIFVRGGATFANLTKLSAAGIPTISIVFGSSTAGGAYIPGMSDHTVFVKDRAKVFLGGPPLVKMAINEEANEEDLGGADMHSRVSGLSDHLAIDEHDAIRIGREIVADLNWHKLGPGPSRAPRDPHCDPGELLGVVPADLRTPFDVREIIARIVDASEFNEFKPLYGTQLICGHAYLCGYPVGIIANNGILFSEEANKGAQFIQICNREDVPLIFLQNITGFMVGTKYEQGGIIKDGAKLINAVSNSSVPHLTVMVGASYGAGNYGMSGQAFGPRFVLTWPNHRIAVMGPKQLAGVMSIIQSQKAEKAGVEYDMEQDAFMRTMIEAQIEKESTALFATGRLWDDGIIDPRDTRTALGICLSAAHSAPVEGASSFGIFRM